MGTFGYLSAWTFSEDEVACAPVGATAKLGIKQSGGTKALVITKKTADTVVILYQE